MAAHTLPQLVHLTGLSETDVIRYMAAYQAVELEEENCMLAPDLRVCLQSLGFEPTDEELHQLILHSQWEHITKFVDLDGFVFLMKAIVSQEVPCTLRT
jgi:hypothetical protein